jgi:putative permease
MLAVLLFGSLWGVVGVFFAVPLVVLVKSVLEVFIPPRAVSQALVSEL